jgi:hypothetical protein
VTLLLLPELTLVKFFLYGRPPSPAIQCTSCDKTVHGPDFPWPQIQAQQDSQLACCCICHPRPHHNLLCHSSNKRCCEVLVDALQRCRKQASGCTNGEAACIPGSPQSSLISRGLKQANASPWADMVCRSRTLARRNCRCPKYRKWRKSKALVDKVASQGFVRW